jgi:hypothetical protein
MNCKQRAHRTFLAVLGAVIGVGGVVAQQVQPFFSLQPGFTQELFGSTRSFLIENTGYLGGVTVLPRGDVMSAECVFTGTRLHRFSAATTTQQHGAALHAETILPSDGGCGMVYHPDGTLYLNTKPNPTKPEPSNPSDFGITNVDPDTGVVLRRLGPRGNAVGITVDPVTSHIVYAGSTCAPGMPCTLFDLDPVTGVAVPFRVFTAAEVSYANGIRFDPTGAYLFIANRTPNRLIRVNRAGVIVQPPIPMGTTQPVGLGFSATSPKFVVTNNTNGTMTRFDFPNDDFGQAPVVSTFAAGGFRGDLMEAGSDGCLYLTQGGTRFPDGTTEEGTESNSIVRICGGAVQFAPPPGVPLQPPATDGVLQGVVTNAANGAVVAGATVQVSPTLAATTDAAGRYSVTAKGGTYTVTVMAATFATLTAPGVTVTNGQTTTQNFVLTPLPTTGTLQGVVTTAGGAVVPNAVVTLSNGSTATTNAAGAYAMTVAGGTYSATVTAVGYHPASANGIVVTNGETTTRNFTLVALPPPVVPGTLTGTVSNATNGGLVPGATVRLSNGASATTNAQGKYALTGLTPGTYSATVTASGYDPATASGIVIANGGTTTKNFALTATPPPNPCKKANDYFGLGVAGNYTLFTVEVPGCANSWIELTGNTRVGGDVGIGPEGDATLNGTIEGKLAYDPSATVVKNNTVIKGGTQKIGLGSAASAVVAAAARLAKLKPTQELAAITGSATIKGTGGINVIALPSLFVRNGTVTIQGKPSDLFVLNVAGKFELDGSRVILSGGVLPCNVLWNFTGSEISEANEVELENGSSGVGILLAPTRLVDLQESTLTGRVLSGGDVIVHSSTIKPQ